MTNISLSEQISNLISPNSGGPQPWTDDDKKFAAEYTKAVEELSDDTKLLTFRNVISGEGRCGFASAGTNHYLVNTDGRRRYRVTVRTYWRHGIESGQYDRIYVTEAGSRQHLGCSDSGGIPTTYYSRQVVGEVDI